MRPLPHGALRVFLEADNVTNHGNPCCVDYRTVESPGGTDLSREVSSWLPRIFLARHHLAAAVGDAWPPGGTYCASHSRTVRYQNSEFCGLSTQ